MSPAVKENDENEDFTLKEDKDKRIGVENPEHIFIEGDNYPALKLLEKDFKEKIGIIYIDPPYNTGKTFTFCDADFSEETGGQICTGVKNKDKHGAWLSFMARRLKAAQKLLRPDGCIFIAIGTEELYRLKILCDEIFGEENFVNDFMWLHGKGKKDKWSRTLQQSNLCYAKNKKYLRPFCDFEISVWARSNVDGDERGNWFSGSISFSEARSNPLHKNFYEIHSPSGKVWKRQWLVSREKMSVLLAQNKIYFGSAPKYESVPRVKIFNGEQNKVIPKNIIGGTGTTRNAQAYVDSLLGEKHCFDNPKPVELVRRLISITGMPPDTVVMDFFAGSGTTLEAVIEQNRIDGGIRRCILIQKKEEIKTGSKYSDIAELCFARIRKILNSGSIRYFRLHSE